MSGNPEIDLAAFARESWNHGERDEKEAASRYLTEALASAEAFEMLFQPVYERFSSEFRRFRKALEQEIGAWDNEPPAVQTSDESHKVHGGSEDSDSLVHTANESHEPNGQGATTAFDKRLLLREQLVFIVGKGKIPWLEVTIDDIDATMNHYRAVIAGYQKSIEFLASAKRLMIRYGVERLGDVPFDAISGILPE